MVPSIDSLGGGSRMKTFNAPLAHLPTIVALCGKFAHYSDESFDAA